MLQKLTPEQEKFMITFRNEYIDFIINNYKYSNDGKNKLQLNDIKDDIDWIYTKAKLDKPKFIFIADSYLQEKLMINYIRNEFNGGQQLSFDTNEQVWRQVNRQVGEQVDTQVGTQVGRHVWDQVYEQVGKQVYDQVWTQVIDQIWAQIWDQVRAQVGEQVNRQVIDQVSDQVWRQVRVQVGEQVIDQVSDQVWRQVRAQVNEQVINQVNRHVWAQVSDQVNRQVNRQAWKQVREQVNRQVGDQVRAQVNRQVGDQTWKQVRAQVSEQVGEQVWEQVNKQVYEQVDTQVGEQVWEQVNKQVYEQVDTQVGTQVGRHVSMQVRAQVSEQVGTQVNRQVSDQVKTQVKKEHRKLEFIEHSIGIGYDIWISFYTYYKKIGILKNDDFDRFSSFILKGVWSIQFFKHWCILTRMPRKINRDAQDRLHSIDESSIIWNNQQDKNYFIHGVSFSEELWEKVVTQKISMKEILQIQNMEQRNAILSVISPKRFIDELDAKLISTYKQEKKGKEYMDTNSFNKINHQDIKLYMINGDILGLNDYIYILLYTDPSTTREYFSFIDPNNAKSAEEAMASKFGLTVQEYLSITAES